MGVDFSLPRLAASAHQNAQSMPAPVAADAQRLPFREGVFDVSYTRFLLEYQPDPQKVVDEMVRATRTGGIVLLQDLDGQLVTHHPPGAEFQHALEFVLTGLAGATGNRHHPARSTTQAARRARRPAEQASFLRKICLMDGGR